MIATLLAPAPTVAANLSDTGKTHDSRAHEAPAKPGSTGAKGTAAKVEATTTPASPKAAEVTTAKPADAGSAASDATLSKAQISRPVADKWALVIGISRFKDPNVKLKYATKDATDFYDYLVNTARFAPDHVRLLTDENATREAILDELGDKWLPRVALPDDLVTIFISTHGSPSSVDAGGINYLVAYNTDPNRLYSTGIPIQDLTRLIKDRVHSDRIVVIMDACHSGAAQTGGKALVREKNLDASQLVQGTGQLVICSSEPSQSSWESTRYPNGVFTRQLIESLKQKPSLGDAFSQMREQVSDEVVRDRGELQRPVLKSAWEGSQIVLSARASSPRQGLKDFEVYDGRPRPAAPQNVATSAHSAPPSPSPEPVAAARPVQIATAPPAAQFTPAAPPPAQPAASAASQATMQPSNQSFVRSFEQMTGGGGSAPAVAMLPRNVSPPPPRTSVPARTVPSTIWDSYMQQGRKAYYAGRMEDAERQFNAAAREAEKFGDRDSRVPAGLAHQAMVAVYMNKLPEAETLLKKAIAIDETLPSSQQRQLGSHLEHLAWIYMMQGKNDQAEPLLQRALGIWETQLGGEQAKVSDCLCAIARVYRAQNKLPESETMLTRALSIAKEALGEDDPAVAQIQCDLGHTLCLEGQYQQAEPLLKSAIAVFSRDPGPTNPLLATAYIRLGDVYTGIGKTSPAEVNYRKGLALAEKINVRYLPDLADSLTKLQHLFESNNKTPKANEWQHFVQQMGHMTLSPSEFDYSVERTRQDLRTPPTPENFPAWTVEENLGSGQSREGKWVWNKAKQQFDVLWSTGDREVMQLQKYDNNEVTLMSLATNVRYVGIRKGTSIEGTSNLIYLKPGQSISHMMAPKAGFIVLRAGQTPVESEESSTDKTMPGRVAHTGSGHLRTWKATW